VGTAAGRGSGDARTIILDVAAERLVQRRGFNGVSYADVAEEVGITKPALHYRFARKAELGAALIARCRQGRGGVTQPTRRSLPRWCCHSLASAYASAKAAGETSSTSLVRRGTARAAMTPTAEKAAATQRAARKPSTKIAGEV
jgi:AcrR family transcriptional regulator